MPIIDLFQSTYKLGERGNGTQDVINYYYESYQTGQAKSQHAMIPTNGFDRVMSTGAIASERCRGMYLSSSGTAPDFKPRIYNVSGSKVYRFDADMSSRHQIGNVGDYGLPCTMADNGFNFVVADGVALFKAPLDDLEGLSNYSQIILPVVPKTGITAQPSHVAFIGQRLVINSKNTNYWFYSDLTSPTTLTGGETFSDASFYSAEQSSDPILALKVVDGSLWIWGTRSYEIWRPQNNQDSPFSYVGGSSSSIGIEAPYSVATVGDMVFWLGASDVGNGTVFMGQGTSATDITEGVEDIIRGLSNRSQAIGYAYKFKEHLFYVLTFASENLTIVYDATTAKWHKRLLRNVNEGTYSYYPYVYGTVGNDGEMYFGMYGQDSCVVKSNINKFTEWDGRMIRRELTSRPIYDNYDRINIKQLMIDCEVGATTLLSGQGSDPEICFQLSKDSGLTYGLSVGKKLGKQGNYRTKVRCNNIGSATFPVFKLWISDAVPCAIYGTRLEYEKWGVS